MKTDPEAISYSVLVASLFGAVVYLGKTDNGIPTKSHNNSKGFNEVRFDTVEEAEAFKMLHIARAFKFAGRNSSRMIDIFDELCEFDLEFDGDIKTYQYTVISSDNNIINTGELSVKIYSSLFPSEVSYKQTIPRTAPVGR